MPVQLKLCSEDGLMVRLQLRAIAVFPEVVLHFFWSDAARSLILLV